MILPVYTLTYIYSLYPDRFRKRGQHEHGDSYMPVGKVYPVTETECSWFTTKVGRRREHSVQEIQRQYKGTLGRVYARSYYSATQYDYMVCSISWYDGAITEHTRHDDIKSADLAIRQRLDLPIGRTHRKKFGPRQFNDHYKSLPTDPNDY